MILCIKITAHSAFCHKSLRLLKKRIYPLKIESAHDVLVPICKMNACMDALFMHKVSTPHSDYTGASFVQTGQFVQKLCPLLYFDFTHGVTANPPTRTLGLPGTKLHMIFVHSDQNCSIYPKFQNKTKRQTLASI